MVDVSQEPYYDDFDENKHYHQILFLPARAVQVRELNQIQTMIQNQIESFGDHVFENGSMVIPGELSYDLSLDYVTVDLTETEYNDISDQLDNQNITIEGQTTGVVAELKRHVGVEGTDDVTFFVKYTKGGTSNIFDNGETVNVINNQGSTIASTAVTGTGKGSSLTVNEGVYYVNGFFVKNDTQTLILDKYSQTPSYKVGFRINDQVVTFLDDESLVDNASGTLNFSAPGADRRQIELKLEKIDLNTTVDEDEFVEIFRVNDGTIELKARGPEYNILEDELARRTYRQSGDFTVEPFGLDLREHLKEGNNRGLYTSAEGGDESKYIAGVEEGIAFVRGYEIENDFTRYIEVDKARDTDSNNNAAFPARIGYYITINSLNIIPNLNGKPEVEFYDDVPGSPGDVPNGNLIGRANVRAITKPSDLGSGEYALHIFNVRDDNDDRTTDFVNNIASAFISGSPNFTAETVESDPEIKESSDRSAIFPLPNSNVQTLLDGSGETDTTYEIIRSYNRTADANGIVNINSGSNEVFTNQSLQHSLAANLTDSNIISDIPSKTTLTGSPTGSSIEIDLGTGAADDDINLNLVLVRQQPVQKSKSPTTQTVSGTLTNNRLSLEKADAYQINSVILSNDGTDVTDRFELNPNKTQTYYGVSYIELVQGASDPGETIEVEFEYFQHGSGDYFSVDSYTAIDYADIPVETVGGESIRMSDALDFRPRMADDGSGFTGAGSSSTAVPVPDDIIQADISYYLSRIDKVYVNSRGEFGVRKGQSALNPKEPNEPDNSMILYKLEVPAYTFSVDDIDAELVNNKRYTMRDIGRLEGRIENIEYYTALNSLERDASEQQLIDESTGLPRFKNGFVADPFRDHTIGLAESRYYKAAVDGDKEQLRPLFNIENVDMQVDSGSGTNVVVHDNLITLDYAETTFINQNKASGTLNVNPYAKFRYVGSIDLSPNSDTWADTRYSTPQINLNFDYNIGFGFSYLGFFNSRWGSWRNNWLGTISSKPKRDENTSNNSSNTKVVNNRIVDVSASPYMRERDITFNAKGLKPNTTVNAFFDNADVGAYCKPDGGSLGDPLVTDADGKLSGTFELPNNDDLKFKSGTKRFVLTDSDSNDDSQALTLAKTNYTSKGAVDKNTDNVKSTTSIERVSLDDVNRQDSIAQSFMAEGDGGIFITSVDLFFANKDEGSPVGIEIREMRNGIPGQKIVPYSKVIVDAADVNVSDDASVATTFTFSDPLFLDEDTEYCIVLLCNSVSYDVYVAGLGQNDINTGDYISKQPHEGVLFKTTNNRTWSENQEKDLMFRVNRADFNLGTGSVTFTDKGTEKIRLGNNPIKVVNGSTTATATIPDHGLMPNSYFTLEGCEGSGTVSAADLNQKHIVGAVVDENRVEFTLDSTPDRDNNIGGDSAVSTRNYLVDNITPVVEDINLTQTSIAYSITGTTGKSIDGNENPFQNITYQQQLENKEEHDTVQPWLILSDVDATENHSGDPSLDLDITLESTSGFVSPVIDMNRTSVIVAHNIINSPDTVDESTDEDGNVETRYMTKQVSLNDPANAIKVFMDINKPSQADILVYYRTGSTEEEIETTQWQELDTVNEPSSSDSGRFAEAEYEVEGISSFNIMQVKIVMVSTSSSNVPKVKRFRAIALGT